MATRSIALCDGKYIGIETIYTVINGQQINIPEKLKALREKSQSNQLFCPCGCGVNLILVAGDRRLKEQHFRAKHVEDEQKCHMITEGKVSVDSKIVLKCWLEDKLKIDDIETRVPIKDISDSERKYEFSFLSEKRKFAVSYVHERVNLSNEKFEILKANSKGLKIVCIVDSSNGGTSGQFPEAMMRVQEWQGYCLLLSIDGIDYYKAVLKAVFYAKDIDGIWQEHVLAEDKLTNYIIDEKNDIYIKSQSLAELLERAIDNNNRIIETTREQRVKQQIAREEELARLREQEKNRQEALRKEAEEKQKELERIAAEEKVKKAKREEEKRLQDERKCEEERRREEEFINTISSSEVSADKKIIDPSGVRWAKCEYCGKFMTIDDFSSYGGPGRVNLGTCKECSKNNRDMSKYEELGKITSKKYDPNICPECGGVLREKSGRYGRFKGCSNYPKCKYTQRI